MTKRGRDHHQDTVKALTVRPEEACAVLVAAAAKWRDRCGAEFVTEHKIEKQRDRVLLKLGFYDELECSNLCDLKDTPLPGDYVVDDVEVSLTKKAVVVTLARSAAGRAAVRAKTAPTAPDRTQPVDEAEAMRLRVSYDVTEQDADEVSLAVRAVTSNFDRPSDTRLMRVAHRPGLYAVYISVHSATVPFAVLAAASAYDAYIDLDNNHVVVHVQKALNDID